MASENVLMDAAEADAAELESLRDEIAREVAELEGIVEELSQFLAGDTSERSLRGSPDQPRDDAGRFRPGDDFAGTLKQIQGEIGRVLEEISVGVPVVEAGEGSEVEDSSPSTEAETA